MIDGQEQGEGQAPAPTPKEPPPKSEMPSRFTLYDKVLEEMKMRIADYIDKKIPIKDDSPKKLLSEGDEILYINFKDGRRSLVLPTVGSDEVELNTVLFEKVHDEPNDDNLGTLEDHDFITLELNLFHNGLPWIADGDLNIDDKEVASRYLVVLGREMAPVIVQQQQTIDEEGYETRKYFEKARKHKLTDLESERILDAVKTLGIPDHVLT